MSYFAVTWKNYNSANVADFAEYLSLSYDMSLSWDSDVLLPHINITSAHPLEVRHSQQVILDRQNLTPIAYMPPMLIAGCPPSGEDCQIYFAHDGSVVTLYWFGNRWRIASAHTTDLSDKKQYGCRLTYREVVQECLAQYGFGWDKLDTSVSYTVCFSHPAYHPLQREPQLTLVAALDTNGFPVFIEELPVEYPLQINIEEAEQVCANALDVYLTQEDPQPEYASYGFVVHSGGCRYLMSSALMGALSKLLYDAAILRELNTLQRNTRRIMPKLTYCALRAQLNGDRALFCGIFRNCDMEYIDESLGYLRANLIRYGETKKGSKHIAKLYENHIRPYYKGRTPSTNLINSKLICRAKLPTVAAHIVYC